MLSMTGYLKDRIVLKKDLESFFGIYKNAVDSHTIKAKNIWNCDETMLDGGKSKKKAMCEKHGRSAIRLEQNFGEHITLLFFVSAEGEWLKPLAIFPLKTLPEFATSVYEDFNISGQESGWIDGPIYRNYIQNFFVDEINKKRQANGEDNEPVLLIMDHHSSRDGLDAKLLWDQHKILLLLIPAHSSHIVQPLDLSSNGEFKQKLRERFKTIPNEDASSRRNRLMQISARVLSRINNKDTIKTGWEHTGLWPFNPEVAFRSSAVVEAIEHLPSSGLKKKRKRGVKINGGQIIYNGMNILKAPPRAADENATLKE